MWDRIQADELCWGRKPSSPLTQDDSMGAFLAAVQGAGGLWNHWSKAHAPHCQVRSPGRLHPHHMSLAAYSNTVSSATK